MYNDDVVNSSLPLKPATSSGKNHCAPFSVPRVHSSECHLDAFRHVFEVCTARNSVRDSQPKHEFLQSSDSGTPRRGAFVRTEKLCASWIIGENFAHGRVSVGQHVRQRLKPSRLFVFPSVFPRVRSVVDQLLSSSSLALWLLQDRQHELITKCLLLPYFLVLDVVELVQKASRRHVVHRRLVPLISCGGRRNDLMVFLRQLVGSHAEASVEFRWVIPCCTC